jgi:hypothetical protein
MSINKTKVFAIFQDADNSQASFATRLFDEGIYDRVQALPLVIEYVEQAYKVKAVKGQRGMMFEKNSASEQAKKRILANCFETAPKAKANTQNKKDPLDALLAKIKALPKADQKRIKDAI